MEQDLSQLYKDQFDNIKSNYENQIDLSEYLRDSDEKTYTQSTEYFDDMRGVYSKNLELLTSEAKDLEEQLQKAVDSDAVEVGSEAWQEMKKDIDGVNKKIAQTNVELAKLYTEQFEYIQSGYQSQISLNDYLRDANEKTYTESTTYFEDMRDIHQDNLSLLTKEATELEKQFREAVDSGAIEKGSEAWKKMKKSINDVNKEISQTNVEIAQLYTEQFNYIQNNYKNQIASYNSLHSANEKNFTETTHYYDEMRSIQTMTLLSLENELGDLEEEYKEAMATDKIKKGSQAWYEMRSAIDDTKRSISEIKVELKQLYLDEFSYIQDGFEKQLSLYNHYADIYSKKSTLLETQGYMTSGKLLSYQKGIQEKNIGTLKNELVSLETELNVAMNKGDIKQYSDAWYSMTSSINAVKEAIYDVCTQTEKLKKAQEQLSWDKFTLKQESIGQISSESDFLLSMMEHTDLYDKKGRLTDTGLASVALRNVRADTLNKQSRNYLSRLTGVEQRLAEDPNNEELIKKKQELIKLSQESALAMENEQKAIVSMVEDGIKIELDSLKELIDTYKDALDSTKDLYDYQSQLADKSSDIAKIQKQLSAYANDTSEETKATVQKLQVELSDAQKDLRDTEYERSVSDQKKLLDEMYTEYENFLNTRLDDTNRILEDMRLITNAIPGQIGEVLREVSNSASLHLSSELNSIFVEGQNQLDAYNASHEADRQITVETLNEASGSWGTFGENLRGSVLDAYAGTDSKIGTVSDKSDIIKTTVDYNAHGIEAVFNNLENSGGQIIANSDNNKDDIINYVSGKISSIDTNNNFTTTIDSLKKIEQHVKEIAEEADKRINTFIMGDIDFDESVTSNDAIGILRGGTGLQELDDNQIIVADLNEDGVINSDDALETLRIATGKSKSKKVKSFSTGGLADYTGVANIHGTKDKPELVLNADDTKNFIKLNDTLREIMRTQSLDLLGSYQGIESPALQLSKMPSMFSGINKPEIIHNTTINLGGIDIDHVQDYNDFVNQMKMDKKFEKLIKTMSVGDLNGGHSIDKYKYRW